MDDAPFDRRHRRKQLLAAPTTHPIRNLPRAPAEVFLAMSLELLAIELDLFLDLAADERLVCEHLDRVEQLPVPVDQSATITAVETHMNLCFVLFTARHDVETG